MKRQDDETCDKKAGPRVGSPLFLRKHGLGFSVSRKRKKAFSMVELVLCLLLWAAFAGAVLTTFLPYYMEGRNRQIALREAENITRWIQRNLIKACIERRAFDIDYYSVRQDFIKIQWYSPPEQKTYKTDGKCWIKFATRGRVKPRYSPAWHTMTPAVTFNIYTTGDKNSTERPVARITISGYCLVTLHEVQ
jgi:type II secretory pathway pseudopilin PulG